MYLCYPPKAQRKLIFQCTKYGKNPKYDFRQIQTATVTGINISMRKVKKNQESDIKWRI